VAPEQYDSPTGFTLSLNMSDESDAERIFHELAADGRVVMPLEQTFWAARFGVVVDRRTPVADQLRSVAAVNRQAGLFQDCRPTLSGSAQIYIRRTRTGRPGSRRTSTPLV
jgi:hypothetical protein